MYTFLHHPLAPTVPTSNEMPRFDHACLRVNYKEAFGGETTDVVKSKTMKAGKGGSPVKASASATVLPQNKMITFSGLQQLQKHAHTHSTHGGRDYNDWPVAPPRKLKKKKSAHLI